MASIKSSVILIVVLAVTLTTGVCVTDLRAEDPLAVYDLEMMSRPDLPVREIVQVFPDGLMDLWLKALDRPDAELRRITIDTIAIAHRRRLPGVEAARPRIVELLNEPNQRLDVVKAAAKLLIKWKSQDLAQDDATHENLADDGLAQNLAKQATKRGIAVNRLVEPALARWKSPAMREQWRERLNDPTANEELLILAIDGLAALSDHTAIDRLKQITSSPLRPISTRMHAAQALGVIESPDSVDFSRQLELSNATNGQVPQPMAGPINGMLAIRVLASADERPTVDRLIELARHSNTAVQSQALRRLYQIDPLYVDELADELIESPDANVRHWSLKGMLRKPVAKRVQAIAPLLHDPIPAIRQNAAKELMQWSNEPNLKEEVIVQVMKVLEQNEWRGCEQAIVVLAQLDYDPAGQRFVQLLKHDRPEVKVASAWGLKQIRDKQWLPAMLDHAESVHKALKFNGPGASYFDELQLAHLFIAFGDQTYASAEDLARAFLPKNAPAGDTTRAAACWAIGLILADDPPRDVVNVLLQRYRDRGPGTPESVLVRRMCVIAFGRMKIKSVIPELRREAGVVDPVGQACYWAIEKMTGEKAPLPPPLISRVDDWFLAPVSK